MPQRIVRFGPFEVDLTTGELRKLGLRLRLQEQPFQVLAALLERPGEVVTREELVRRLWNDGTVVDYDRGLNAAIARLRQALSDSAETPRFLETVAGRGYRLIAKIENVDEAPPPPIPVSAAPGKRHWIFPALLFFALLSAIALWILFRKPAVVSQQQLQSVPLTTDPGFERNASFSPDGNQVAYEWDKGDGDRHIYIKLVGPGEPIQLTKGPGAEYGPAWSGDGRFIAFLRRLDDTRMAVLLIPALGGEERKLAEFPPPGFWVLNNAIRRLDWTPDSKFLVVSGPEKVNGGDGLFAISVETGQKTWLTAPSADPSLGDRAPAVSPDGRSVVFVRGALLSSNNIYLLPISGDSRPAGEPRVLTSPGQNPQWMPNGKEILFTAFRGLWKIGIGSGSVRTLVMDGDGISLPAIARRNRLAYTRSTDDLNIWRQEVPTRSGKSPAPMSLISSTASDMNGQYSSDGTRIAFQSGRSGSIDLWVCSDSGQRCYQLTALNGPPTGWPSWSPDGTRVAFDSSAAGNFEVYVIDASGGVPKRLTSDRAFDGIPNWSRDGKWIYFSSTRTGQAEIWKLPSLGGDAIQVTHNGGFTASESPDGKFLYYTKTEEKARLWKSLVDGSGETPVLDNVAQRGFVVTPDRIYYLRAEVDRGMTLRYRVLATGEDVEISSIPEKGISRPQLVSGWEVPYLFAIRL